MWNGYVEYAGIEIVNVARTETYAKGAGWFRPVYQAEGLAPILSETYNSPLQDDAPWTDPDVLDSYDFWGCYPLDITGVDDSTATASVIESTLDGGLVGRARRSTRSVVFNLALVGASECAVEYGFRWLKTVLSGAPCAGAIDQTCQGATMCYLSCEPCIDIDQCVDGDASGCLVKYLRSLHKVAPITGPIVASKGKMIDGGCAWVAQFTLVAGNPYEFSGEQPLIRGFMKRDEPYVVDVPDGTPEPSTDGETFNEVACPVRSFQPVNDPLCPAEDLPPSVPQSTGVQLSCFNLDVNYKRRSFVIPQEFIPLWSDIVPYIEIHVGKFDVRNLRLRFYSDVLGHNNPNRDPCAFCGDIVFSYIPPNSTLVFDGTDEVVYVETAGGQKRRADSVVFASDGGPFEWPQLSCGYQYIVTWDLPQSADAHLPSIDLSLYARTV